MNLFKKVKIAYFLIFLIVSMPIYASSVFAQLNSSNATNNATNVPVSGADDVPVPNANNAFVKDPVQSCLDKSRKTSDLVDLLDSGVISTLEKIASTLYFICTVWATVESVIDAYLIGFGFIDIYVAEGPVCIPVFDECWAGSPSCNQFLYRTCQWNVKVRDFRDMLSYYFEPVCSISECVLCGGKIGNVGRFFSDSDALREETTFEAEQKESPKGFVEKSLGQAHISPFDNIYVAIGCLCPVAILFNLRKLKTIYQTYNCCVDQACANGINVQACERQLSEATCMYWEGSIIVMLIKILISIVANIIANAVMEQAVEHLGLDSNMAKTIFALFSAYQHIQRLATVYDWMSKTFSEPQCEDLGFDKIRDQRRSELGSTFCDIIPVDTDGDGISDTVRNSCT